MIKDLITRLMEEANEEAEHKGWCDTELATNKQTRQEKTEAVDTLAAEIDELEVPCLLALTLPQKESGKRTLSATNRP